jgi:hypothetical protein
LVQQRRGNRETDLFGRFQVDHKFMYWFDIREDCRSTFAPPGFPIFIWIFAKGGEFGFYGFPTLDGKTINIATEQFRAITSAWRTSEIFVEVGHRCHGNY